MKRLVEENYKTLHFVAGMEMKNLFQSHSSHVSNIKLLISPGKELSVPPHRPLILKMPFFFMFFADIYVNLSRKPKDTSLQMSVYLFVRGEGYVLGLCSNRAANCQFGRNKSKCHCATPVMYNVSLDIGPH